MAENTKAVTEKVAKKGGIKKDTPKKENKPKTEKPKTETKPPVDKKDTKEAPPTKEAPVEQPAAPAVDPDETLVQDLVKDLGVSPEKAYEFLLSKGLIKPKDPYAELRATLEAQGRSPEYIELAINLKKEMEGGATVEVAKPPKNKSGRSKPKVPKEEKTINPSKIEGTDVDQQAWKLAQILGMRNIGNSNVRIGALWGMKDLGTIGRLFMEQYPEEAEELLATWTPDIPDKNDRLMAKLVGLATGNTHAYTLEELLNHKKKQFDIQSSKKEGYPIPPTMLTDTGEELIGGNPATFNQKKGLDWAIQIKNPKGKPLWVIRNEAIKGLARTGKKVDLTGYTNMDGTPFVPAGGETVKEEPKEETKEEPKEEPKPEKPKGQKGLDDFVNKSGSTVFELYNSAYSVLKADHDRERMEFNSRCNSIAKSLSSMDAGSVTTIMKSANVQAPEDLVISIAKSAYEKEGRALPIYDDIHDPPNKAFAKSMSDLRAKNPKAFDSILSALRKSAEKERTRIVDEILSKH